MRPGLTGRIAAAALLAWLPWAATRADVNKALADYKAGRYLEAASELQAMVDRSPGYAFGYFLLGHCMLKIKRPGDAEKQFRRAIELDPGPPEYYQGLTMAIKAEADWARTIQAATDGLSRSQNPPTTYALLALRGYAWGALQRWDEAVKDLEAARRIGQDSWVLVLLGKAYFATGAYGPAIRPLQEALESDPGNVTVLRLLAESFLKVAGDEPDATRKKLLYREGLGYAQRLAAALPDDLDVVYLVGRAALGAGQLAQAQSVFLHVLAHDPRQCYAMVNLGRTYMAAGRLQEAEAFLRKAAVCAPRMAVVYETLGDLYLDRGLTQQAAAAYRRAEEIEPTPVDPNARAAAPRTPPRTTAVSAPR